MFPDTALSSFVCVRSNYLITLDASAPPRCPPAPPSRCGFCWEVPQHFTAPNKPRHQDDGGGRRSFGQDGRMNDRAKSDIGIRGLGPSFRSTTSPIRDLDSRPTYGKTGAT